jgi:hypothetical protein
MKFTQQMLKAHLPVNHEFTAVYLCHRHPRSVIVDSLSAPNIQFWNTEPHCDYLIDSDTLSAEDSTHALL